MSDTPEPLAAILAEMRKAVVPMICGRPKIEAVSIRDVLQWADRIEAAAMRERDEDRQLAAIAESDEAFARCARCDRPERAPGNAAALREALERIVNLAPEYPARGVDWNALAADAFLTASAALAAPARNVDRFKTANDAAAAYIAEHPHEDEPGASTYGSWLFDLAEGGAE